MVYVASDSLKLNDIQSSDEIKEDRIDPVDLQKALTTLRRNTKIKSYLEKISTILATFDWRTASADSLTTTQRQKQMIYKGSSGYKEIRNQLLKTLVSSKEKEISSNATLILNELGYAD
jgi:hypothetical protein